MLNLICKFNITEYLVDFNMFFQRIAISFGSLLLFIQQPDTCCQAA